jgi:hypothetical protein
MQVERSEAGVTGATAQLVATGREVRSGKEDLPKFATALQGLADVCLSDKSKSADYTPTGVLPLFCCSKQQGLFP